MSSLEKREEAWGLKGRKEERERTFGHFLKEKSLRKEKKEEKSSGPREKKKEKLERKGLGRGIKA